MALQKPAKFNQKLSNRSGLQGLEYFFARKLLVL